MSTLALPLLHADPVFPQRDLLLDPTFVAQRVAPYMGLSSAGTVEHCRRVRVTYRAGASLRVLYKLEGGGQSHMIAARAFPAGIIPGTRKDRGPNHAAFQDDENNTMYWAFPNDRKITNLPLLMNVPQSLSDLLESRWSHSQLVAYAPEKCATVQCLDDTNNVLAYAKCYAGDEGLECYRTYSELSDAATDTDQFAVPRVIAYSASLHILALEPIYGRRIADLQGEDLERGFNCLGRALAAFHLVPANADLPPFTRLAPENLQGAATAIGAVRPDAAALARQLCDSLCSNPHAMAGPTVRVHGDVHPKNGILRGNGVVLIDLDQAGLAPAAADLGSLLAALRYEVVTGALSTMNERRLAASFLSGYASARKLPHPAELRWHMAAALLAERALRAITRVRIEGLENLRELLLEATRTLEEVHA